MDARHLRHTLSCLVTFFPTLACGEALTDGTMGPVQNLSGQFEVPQTLGTLKGQNLFHSFQSFHIRTGESATFTGDNAIRNVISRVTGDETSEINGKLSSRIGTADFYFINPNGVVFGQGAQIDVPAAFRLSTASEIRFPDGGVFSAANPHASTLSVEKPEAYGFLGNQSGQIRMELAKLNRPAATSVELVGRDISAQSSELNVPSGSVRLEAVGGGDAQVPVGTPSEATVHGAVTLESSRIDLSGEGGGNIAVRAGNLEMAGESAILADTYGNQSGGTIDVRVQNNLTMSGGGTISSSTISDGKGGNVFVKAGNFLIDGQGQTTGITSEAAKESSGDAGQATVDVVDTLSLVNGGRISANTFSSGNAGNITVKAGNFLINRYEQPYFTGIASNAESGSTGQAGQVIVEVDDKLSLVNGGAIITNTFSPRNAGIVMVKAGRLLVDGRGQQTGITSDAAEDSSGDAGLSMVEVSDILSLVNGGVVSSTALGTGHAGMVTVKAGELSIDGRGEGYFTGIANQASLGSSRKAGHVTVAVNGALSLLNGGKISSSTFGMSNAGNIMVNAGNLSIDDRGTQLFTGITSDVYTGSSGDAGQVIVEVADRLSLINGGQISADAGDGSSGSAGQIIVQANDTLSLIGGGKISSNASSVSGGGGYIDLIVKDKLFLNDGLITSATLSPHKAGRIGVNAGQVVMEGNSVITTSTFGRGDAGKIDLKSNTLSIDGQGQKALIVSAAEEASNGNAGEVAVDVSSTLSLINGGRIGSDTYGTGKAGNIIVKAGKLMISGQGGTEFTGISSAQVESFSGKGGDINISVAGDLSIKDGAITSLTNSSHKGGRIEIDANNLTMRGGGALGTAITAHTFGAGDAGDIHINATTLSMDGEGQAKTASINNGTQELSSGNAGKITIAVSDQLDLQNNSIINSSALGTGSAGEITITAGKSLLSQSAIATEAQDGNGGPITIHGGHLIYLKDSEITTSVLGRTNGNGGDINIDGKVLVMETGFIQANTVAPRALGGDIRIDVDALIPSGSRLQIGGEEPLLPERGRFGYNVIQAAAPGGVSGNIEVGAVQLDLSGSIAAISTQPIDLSGLTEDFCGLTAGSSLIGSGLSGGLPPKPGEGSFNLMGIGEWNLLP